MYGALVVSGDPNFLSQVQRLVANINKNIKVETLNDPSKVIEVLRSTALIDVVVCDHDPPRVDAFSLFNQMNRINDVRPFIITTSQVDGEAAIDAFDKRMDYYLARKNLVNFSMDLATKIVLCAERRRSEENRDISDRRMRALMTLLMMRERDFGDVLNYALEESVALTNSTIGYIAMYDEDANKLKMAAWSKGGLEQCKMDARPTTYDFDLTGIWGEPIRQGRPIIVNDYQNEKVIPKAGTPRGHVQLNRLLMIPIYHKGKILATAGIGNKATKYDSEDLMQFTLFMDGLISIYHEKMVEGESKTSEQNLKSILQNAPVGIMILDKDMSILVSNNYAMSMISSNSLDGPKESLKFEHSELSRIIAKDIEKARESDRRLEYEHNIERNGRNIVIKISVAKIKESDNKESGFIVIIDDISELVAVNQQQIAAMEHINLLDRLINDDIWSHLTAMKEDIAKNADGTTETIKSRVKALNEIMTFVKEYHEVGVLEPQWQNLDEVIQKASDATGLNDSMEYNAKGIRILADPSFFNVFSQLMQYSDLHSNGKMKCSVKCRMEGGDITIAYADNSEGIPYESKDDFISGKNMAYGRGIYLAVSILKSCGFGFTESGVPGKGIVVEITVPAPKYSITWE
jgi:PAS domain S-box-containing protein